MANFANWESQLQARANEMLARRTRALKAEIERLQGAVSEIGSRLADQGSVISGEESSSLIEEITRWLNDSTAKVEEDFESRLEDAVADARREAEVQIEELREHLEASRRALTMSSAAAPQSAPQGALFEMFTTASENIVSQRTQSDILAALVRCVAEFAPRVVFFVIKSGDAVGWKASGFENGLNDETVKLLTAPAQKRTLLRDAITSFRLATSKPQSEGGGAGVSETLGDYDSPAPERAIAIPLIVLNKVVAVLYADSGAQPESALNMIAAESLTRIAGATIELLLSRRSAEPARQSAQVAEPPLHAPLKTDGKAVDAPQIEPQIEKTASAAPDEVTIERRLTHELPLVSSTGLSIDDGLRQAEAQLPEPAYIETEPGAMPDSRRGARESVGTVVGVSGRLRFESSPLQQEREQQPTIVETAVDVSSAPISDFAIPPMEEPPDASDIPAFAPPPAPPLFTPPAKPPKPAQPVATVQGSETEQRAHNDARRFARLLVSEIKLYNAAKVNDGRRSYDLYDRLKDEIDRSRKVYDKRVSPAVAARFDYFYDELVQTLAEGDPTKLGADCPGPVAVA